MAEKKPEPAPAPAAEKTAAAAAPAAPSGGGIKVLLPAILAIVLAPAATWAVAQFVLLPKFRSSLAAAVAEPVAKTSVKAAAKPAAKASGHGGGGGAEKEAAADGYKFENVVVNLSGTMGTRYLKTSFLITGEAPDLAERFAAIRPRLTDVTLAVLSSLTLADLEEAGSKNIIRERLLAAYNQVFGEKVAENLYFSEFVVQ